MKKIKKTFIVLFSLLMVFSLSLYKVSATNNVEDIKVNKTVVYVNDKIVNEGDSIDLKEDVKVDVHLCTNQPIPENYEVRLLLDYDGGGFDLPCEQVNDEYISYDVFSSVDKNSVADGNYNVSFRIVDNDAGCDVKTFENVFDFFLENDLYRINRPVIENVSQLDTIYKVGQTFEISIDFTSTIPVTLDNINIEFYTTKEGITTPLQSVLEYNLDSLGDNNYRLVGKTVLTVNDIGKYDELILNLAAENENGYFRYDERKFSIKDFFKGFEVINQDDNEELPYDMIIKSSIDADVEMEIDNSTFDQLSKDVEKAFGSNYKEAIIMVSKDISIDDIINIENETKIAEQNISTLFDISILVGNNKLVETTYPIQFTVSIPEDDLKYDATKVKRSFFILRNHNGEVTELPTTIYNGKVIFQSNLFSTYALVYRDVPIVNENQTSPSITIDSNKPLDNQTSTKIETETTEKPQTDDNYISELYILTGLIAFSGVIFLKQKKYS